MANVQGSKLQVVDVKSGTVPKFDMAVDIAELKKNPMIQHYLSKSTGGKYVAMVNDRLKNITNEDFIILLEAVKVVKLAHTQGKELTDKIKGWTTGVYATSQPSNKLKKAVENVERIMRAHGAKEGEEHSWGAFVQAFQERITPLVKSLMFLQPMAQSFNYSRAAYMIMDSETAYNYIAARTRASLMLVDLVMAGIGTKEFESAVGQQGISRALSKIILEKNKAKAFLPTKAEIDAANLTEVPLTRFDPADNKHAVVAAYMVDFRFYTQSLNFRIGKVKAEDLRRARDLIKMVLDKFAVKINGTVNLKGLAPDGGREAWWQEYFNHVKYVRAVVRSVKRVINNPESVNSSNANIVRNYSDWQITL